MIGQLCTEPAERLNQPQKPVGSLGELGRTGCWMARNLSSVQLEAGEQKLWQSVDPESLWAYVGTSGGIYVAATQMVSSGPSRPASLLGWQH